MGFFKKNKPKDMNNTNDFIGDNNFISGGNLFQMNEELKAIAEKQKLKLSNENYNFDSVDEKLNSYANTCTPFKYFQLWQLCSYFTNMFKYQTDDLNLREAIKQAQIIAFFSGRSGLWFNKVSMSFIPVQIIEIVKTEYNTLKSVKINRNFDMANIEKYQDEYKPNEKDLLTLQGDDLNDIFIYSMKANGLSCWIWLREYTNMQNQLLRQISVASLINNKIVGLALEAKNDNKSLLTSFLDANRFWYFFRKDTKIESVLRVATELIESDITSKYIQIYKDTMDIFNDYVGIRNNTEHKKERNTAMEIDASQSWFDALENEFYFQFKLFIDSLNASDKIISKIEVNYDTRTSH